MAASRALAIPVSLSHRTAEPVAFYEKVLVVVALLIFFGTFKTLLLSAGDNRSDGSPLFQMVSGGLYLASIAIVLARGIPTWLASALYRAWPLLLMTLLPLASTIWSEDPGPTLRRAIALILSSWFAVYVVIRFDPRSLFNLLVIATAIFLAVSIAAAAIPGQGITPSGTYGGTWRGFTGNKNELGRTAGLSTALLIAIALTRMTDMRRTAMIVAACAVPVLLLSRSATSLLSAVLGLGLGGFLYLMCGGRIGRYRLRPELRLLFGSTAAVGGVLLFTVAWMPLLEALARDPTLTGRTKLWDWALAANQDRRWLGSGYRAFWIDENTRYFFVTFAWNKGPEGDRSETFSGPTHAHSGFVDVILELGYVGLGVFIAVVVSAVVSLHRLLADGNMAFGFIFAVIMMFLLVYSMTARAILQQAQELWVLFLLSYFFAIKETLTRRRRT
jgi:O-antigen ligase